jgi:hypothetical protein
MEDNNKIITEFMGFTFEKNLGWYDNDMLMEQIVYDQQNGNCFDKLLFDTDWNWLMGVVEKIESLGYYVKILKSTCVILDVEERCIVIELNTLTKIEVVYNACVEFIKWHNEQEEE